MLLDIFHLAVLRPTAFAFRAVGHTARPAAYVTLDNSKRPLTAALPHAHEVLTMHSSLATQIDSTRITAGMETWRN